jgi:hypothetical protein
MSVARVVYCVLRRANLSSRGILPNVTCLSVIVKRRQWEDRGPLGAVAPLTKLPWPTGGCGVINKTLAEALSHISIFSYFFLNVNKISHHNFVFNNRLKPSGNYMYHLLYRAHSHVPHDSQTISIFLPKHHWPIWRHANVIFCVWRRNWSFLCASDNVSLRMVN